MRRKHIHTRTISKLPPEAFIEEYINDTHKIYDDEKKSNKINGYRHRNSIDNTEKAQQQETRNSITQITKRKKKKVDTAHVVLLGIENTGKTSIFNQLRFFCGTHPISDMELSQCKILCIKHLIRCANQLCFKCATSTKLFTSVSDKNRRLIMKYSSFTEFTIDSIEININNTEHLSNLKKELKTIFQDKGIIKTYSMRNFKIEMNSEYFLNRLYKYFDIKYQCNFQDYLMLYHLTEYPVDELIEDKENKYHPWSITITDVCGQRNKRTSWSTILNIRYTAVLFVISLSDYNKIDKKLNCNKLIEQFELLSSICQIKLFMDNISNFIIILNKKDLFEMLLLKYKISFFDNFPIFLCDRFHCKNWKKNYKDSVYDKENINKQSIANKNRLQFKFDKSREFDSQYIIEFIKKEIMLILPDKIKQNMRIYITCVIQNTFQYVVQTLTQEIVHMEQVYKASMLQ